MAQTRGHIAGRSYQQMTDFILSLVINCIGKKETTITITLIHLP